MKKARLGDSSLLNDLNPIAPCGSCNLACQTENEDDNSRRPETPPTIMTTWTMRFFVRSVFSFVCSFFRWFEKKSKNRSRRSDDFGSKTIKIRAILAIFRPKKKKNRFFFV